MWVVQKLREGKPVYFHCAAGRDRTATLAVLLEGTLGVSESDMAKDYELTYFTPTDWGMSKDDNGNYIRRERSYGQMTRSFYIPGIDKAKAAADFKDGVLKIQLPKLQEQIPVSHQIPAEAVGQDDQGHSVLRVRNQQFAVNGTQAACNHGMILRNRLNW